MQSHSSFDHKNDGPSDSPNQKDEWHPECVICKTDLEDEDELITLKCCAGSYLHLSCLAQYLKLEQNRKCPVCRVPIDVNKVTRYKLITSNDESLKIFKRHMQNGNNVMLQCINLIFCAFGLFIFIYTMNELSKLSERGNGSAGITILYILDMMFHGLIFLCTIFRVIFLSCENYDKKSNDKKYSEQQFIVNMNYEPFRYGKREKICCNYAVTITPDNKTMYFRPVYMQMCTIKQELTIKNWIKIYCIQMFIYFFSLELLQLLYVMLAKHNYIDITVHYILLIATFFIYSVIFCVSGDNCTRQMRFNERTIIHVDTRQGIIDVVID